MFIIYTSRNTLEIISERSKVGFWEHHSSKSQVIHRAHVKLAWNGLKYSAVLSEFCRGALCASKDWNKFTVERKTAELEPRTVELLINSYTI